MSILHRIARFAAAAFFIFIPSIAAAAPGDLDTSFGNGGYVLYPQEPYSATDVKIQSNGRILISGDMAGAAHGIGGFSIVRLMPNGHTDRNFGQAGLAVAQFNSGVNDANSMAIQPDGKIVAAGNTSEDGPPTHPEAMAIARFKQDGQLDARFGTNGTVQLIVAGATTSSAFVVILLPDKKILVGGGAMFAQGQSGVVVRLKPNGFVDTAFGTGGVAKTGGMFTVTGLGLQEDGKIVAQGGNVAVRLLKNGMPDPNTTRSTLIAQQHYGAGMLTPDEKIVEALDVHDSQSGSDMDTQAFRLFPDGKNDTTFVSPMFDFLSSADDIYQNIPFGIALQNDGSVLIAGQGQDTNAVFEGGLARLAPSGPLDPTFGHNGIVASVLDGNDIFTALAQQPNGKIVAAGLSFVGNGKLVIARYDSL